MLADLNGKGGHIRTVPVPDWVKTAINQWAIPASIISGTLFRSINKAGRVWGTGFTPKVIWSIVKQAASNSGLSRGLSHRRGLLLPRQKKGSFPIAIFWPSARFWGVILCRFAANGSRAQQSGLPNLERTARNQERSLRRPPLDVHSVPEADSAISDQLLLIKEGEPRRFRNRRSASQHEIWQSGLRPRLNR